MKAANRLLAYMYHTRNRTAKIYFEGKDQSLKVYTDASFITDLEDCRSVYGIKFYHGRTLVHYVSKKIRTLCSSTTEAEYITMAQGIKIAYWLEEILQGLRSERVIDVYTDSQSGIKWAKEEETKQSRYVPLRYHIARQAVLSGRIRIHYVPTTEQKADELTKAKMPFGVENNTDKTKDKFRKGAKELNSKEKRSKAKRKERIFKRK